MPIVKTLAPRNVCDVRHTRATEVVEIGSAHAEKRRDRQRWDELLPDGANAPSLSASFSLMFYFFLFSAFAALAASAASFNSLFTSTKSCLAFSACPFMS